jgi:predicted CxxxxCH...CXXCH cytochrome family protein
MAVILTLAAACASERDRGGEPSGGVHAEGILEPASPDFHGTLLHDLDWDFARCQDCHGDDFAGGTSGVSCLECHEDGPTACDTCHDESTGAHPTHLGAAEPVPCGECHAVPERWDAPGHILVDGGRDEAPPEVVLGALAARDLDPPRRTSPPEYQAATQTCSAVYCHGGTLGDTAASETTPSWYETGGPRCGTCHGEPPDDHASARCDSCHRGGTHLDAVLDVGAGCSDCHGDDGSPAPPRSLAGATSPQVLEVGVHRAHLTSSTLRGPVECTECHLVPSQLGTAGHIDSAEPAELIGSVGWDRPSASCTNWCHGAAAPVWNSPGTGEAACGTCHGLPPVGLHDPDWTLDLCTTCHPSVDEFGVIVFTGPDTSEHLDGTIDLR